MNKSIVLFCILILFFGCDQSVGERESAETLREIDRKLARINYAINLKNEVAQKHWPEMAKLDLFNPMAFYTYEGTYVLNPNGYILKNFEHEWLNEAKAPHMVLELAPKYLDTVNFNYANSYTASDSTALYYKDDVLLFTDFDLTRKFIPDINDLQDWSIMVLHELFHAYQMSIVPFNEYNKGLMLDKDADEYLGTYHKDLDWYKESVKKENDLLSAVWKDSADLSINLSEYTTLRDTRINRIKEEYGLDIREVEDFQLMVEGQARFFEGLTKSYLAENTPDTSMLEAKDLKLITGMFNNYDPKKDRGLYNIYNDRYWYPMGYNISMILKRYLPEYQEVIYKKANNFNEFITALEKL